MYVNQGSYRTSCGMTFKVLCNSSSARVNRARSFTFDSCRKSHVAVSHSLRRTFKTARASAERVFDSSRRATPHSALKCATSRVATNVERFLPSFA